MAEIITTLHPDGDESTNLYPNIKKENIPYKAISTNNLDDDVLSLIGSLKPSGTDTSTNILAYTSNKGIYVATDNGHWYYWNGDKYADGGIYQSSEDIEQIKSDLVKLENGGITPPMLSKEKGYGSEVVLEPIEVFQDKYIGNYSTTDLSPNIMDGGKYTIKEVDVETASKLVFPVGTTAGYSYNNAITFSGFYSDIRPNLYLNGYTLDNLKAKDWAVVTEETITIDLALMKKTEGFKLADMNPTWDMLRYAYVSLPNASDEVITEVITAYNETLDNFKWLDIADDTEIVVPSKWIACTGLEYNFYKDNCLLGRRIDDVHLLNFAVTDGERNTNWYQDKYRSIWIPRSNMVTDRVISLYKDNHKTLTQSKNISCVSVSPTSGSGKTRSAIIIGDSKIAGGRVVERVYKKCNENGMNFTLKGTIQAWGMSQYNHEGRSGWSAYNYTHDASYRDVVNPFWYNGAFNFSYYMTSNGYTDVDYVFINLGTNDVSMGYGDEFIKNVDVMITNIHYYNPNIHIIIGLNEGMCTREYNSNILDFNEKVQELHKKEIARWDNRENEKIYVCPIYLSMDYYNDYDMTEVPLSAVDTECETSKTRISVDDTTHQSKVGYYKNGDYMFAMIQYIESLT